MKISDKNNRGSKLAIVKLLMKETLLGFVDDFKLYNMVNGTLTLTEIIVTHAEHLLVLLFPRDGISHARLARSVF